MFQDSRNDIKLNFLPIRFNTGHFEGGELPYESDSQLKKLRIDHGDSYSFLRNSNFIECIPLKENLETLGKKKTFSIINDFTLAKRLVSDSLIRFLKEKSCELSSIYPTIRMVYKEEDIVSKIVGGPQAESPIFMHPLYEIESRVILPYKEGIKFGLIFNFSTIHGFNATVSDLIKHGINILGRYLEEDRDISLRHVPIEPKFDRRLVGKAESVNGNIIKLSDFRDKSTVEASKCFLEPRLENINYCLNSMFPDKYEQIIKKKQEEIFQITGAKNYYERLHKIIRWLKRNAPIKCSKDLSFEVADEPFFLPGGRDAGNFRFLASPTCVLRPGGSITEKWPIDPHLEKNGPFDSESFPKKTLRIAVIFPSRFKGEVEIFMRQFRDGISENNKKYNKFIPYSQGFLRKYRLTNCAIELRSLDGNSESPDSYRKKCLEVLAEDIPYDLAIVVIREEFHKLRGKENPYLISKSIFMSQGLPVQEVEIETIQDERSRVYVLNNLSLACYAKLGGIPWVLSSVQGLTHELIFGIGSAITAEGRLSSPERVVGITTVFSGDGNYLLTNVSREVSFDDYQKSLLEVLHDTINQIKKRYAWQPKDKVRMIFHQTFKKYKDTEAAAVKKFVSEISDFDLEYAFVHISRNHPWKLFDLNSKGIFDWENGQKRIKGEYVPYRGCYVPLGPKASLLSLTGPHQLKTHLQGCPEPLLISLHKESTFSSLDYVAEQIYKLSFMSWRSFFPSSVPVTVFYSDLIANLLGLLKEIPQWNQDMLLTRLRESRWFL